MTQTISPSDETSRLLRSAAAAQQQGRHYEAAGAFEQVLRHDPANPIALNALGMQALGRNDHAGARDLFRRAAAADPGASVLWLNLATTARALRDDAEEQAALERALETDQLLLMGHLRLAELHERTGNLSRAWKHWGAVLSAAQMMEPLPPELAPIVARAQAFVGQRNQLFGRAIDEGLTPERDALSVSDRRRFDAAIDATLGRRRIYENICSGLRFPFLPADEYFDRAHFPWMEAIEARTEAIRGEFEAILADAAASFSPYVAMEKGTPANIWSKLDHSLDWSALHLWRHGVQDRGISARCPETSAALAALPQADLPRRSPTAFFSVLQPHTHIPPHGGVSNIRATCHLALVVPPGCRFRVGGETREWREGQCWAFDDTIEHEAWNDSDHMRAVLIFDVWNPHLTEVEKALLRTFYLTADASGHDPGMLET
jgi:aspartate beta-hydroxylase